MSRARSPERAGSLGVVHVAVAGVVVGLVLAQAVLAGRFLFEGGDIALHGHLGNATFALTALGVVLAVVRRLPGWAFALAVTLVALTFAQVGLGYVGRESGTAAAWHIPLGVAIFGVASVQLAALLTTPAARSASPG